MTRKITAVTARTQFGQILDRAVDHNERFLVERNGEPAVLIMSVTDFVKTLAPAPDWLKDIQEHAKRKGLDKLTMDDIDAEIRSRAARGPRTATAVGRMIRVVLDTNIVISAPLWAFGLPEAVFNWAIDEVSQLCLSEAILAEYQEVLGRTRLAIPPRQGGKGADPVSRRKAPS
jgi:prevent-host-death family protein